MSWSPLRRRTTPPGSSSAEDAPTDDAPTDAVAAADVAAATAPRKRRPLYHRLLRLRHISPTSWQRAALADGPFAIAVVLVLADLATAWTLLALPVAVAVVVKCHDVLAGVLAPRPDRPTPDTPTAPSPRGRRRRGGSS